jgi:hypothetical protein
MLHEQRIWRGVRSNRCLRAQWRADILLSVGHDSCSDSCSAIETPVTGFHLVNKVTSFSSFRLLGDIETHALQFLFVAALPERTQNTACLVALCKWMLASADQPHNYMACALNKGFLSCVCSCCYVVDRHVYTADIMLRWLLQLKKLIIIMCTTMRGMLGNKLELDDAGTLTRALLFFTGDVGPWRLDAVNTPSDSDLALRRKALSQLARVFLKHATAHGSLLTAIGVSSVY